MLIAIPLADDSRADGRAHNKSLPQILTKPFLQSSYIHIYLTINIVYKLLDSSKKSTKTLLTVTDHLHSYTVIPYSRFLLS